MNGGRPWKRDVLHTFRSAVPGSPGARSAQIGNREQRERHLLAHPGLPCQQRQARLETGDSILKVLEHQLRDRIHLARVCRGCREGWRRHLVHAKIVGSRQFQGP